MKTKPAACTGCPAFSAGQSYVPGRGPTSARLAVVGQGPGEREAWSGLPFVGPSGQMLEDWMHKAKINPLSVYIDNVVRCWLPENRKPTVAEVDFCYRTHVHPALSALTELTVLVPCGVPAMKHFLGHGATARSAGTCTTTTLRSP